MKEVVSKVKFDEWHKIDLINS